MRARHLVLTATLVAGLFAARPAAAGHHLWDFTQAFSNANGSIQYVELFTSDNSEAGVGAFGITQGANSFSFVTNLSTSVTAHTWILVATPGFGSLPGGVTPDYILPANFLNTAGGTLNYAGGVDVWAYGALPTDGHSSLLRNGSTTENAPHNFAGAVGHINVAQAPGLPRWGLILLVGAMLLVGSGLLYRREAQTLA